MSKKIEIDKDWLYQKYIVERLTQLQIGELVGASCHTIGRRIKEYGIISSNRKIKKPFILNEYQREVIDGALLGDGCMLLSSDTANPCFSYLSSSEEHVRYVCDSLKEYARKSANFHVYNYIRKTTNEPYKQCIFRTQSNSALLPIYNRWYIDKIKHIPKDLKLTKTVCLMWYLGDGTMLKSGEIHLCTNCFLKSEIEEILLPQLKDFEATIAPTSKLNQYVVYIPHRRVEDFLNYIGPCPVQDYKHKWNVVPYKKQFLKYLPELEEKIIIAYKNGSSINGIGTYFNISSYTVESCLKRYNIDTTQNYRSTKPVSLKIE